MNLTLSRTETYIIKAGNVLVLCEKFSWRFCKKKKKKQAQKTKGSNQNGIFIMNP
jgi:hypothetical protein